MKITSSTQYPADVSTVFDMMRNQEFQNHKCEELGVLSHTVSIDEVSGVTTIAVEQTLSTADMPPQAKSYVGDAVVVVEKNVWGPCDDTGARTATVEVTINGAPLKVSGTARLEPSDQGCNHLVDTDLKASIPMLGRMIEQAAAPLIQEAIDHDAKMGQEWLARHS